MSDETRNDEIDSAEDTADVLNATGAEKTGIADAPEVQSAETDGSDVEDLSVKADEKDERPIQPRKPTDGLVVGAAGGIVVGLLLGFFIDKVALCLIAGLLLGTALGVLIDEMSVRKAPGVPAPGGESEDAETFQHTSNDNSGESDLHTEDGAK